jgi:hypothetical protein
MTPWEYAQRYLPIQVPGNGKTYPINIGRYHRGNPTPAQQKLLSDVIDHFAAKQRDKTYRLKLTVNDETIEIADRREISRSLQVPFLGKGSPEDCQIVLQLALLVGKVTPERLRAWADDNLGLDCNGYVGNYLFHDLLQQPWRVAPKEGQIGPSTTIDGYFERWGDTPITDLSRIDPNRMHLIARVDSKGKVIKQYSEGKAGHVAITQPGEIRKAYATDTGDADPDAAKLGMAGKLALRTVESGGPINGVGRNWLVFIKPSNTFPGVFSVNRDKIHFDDTIRIAPLRPKPL